MEEWQIEIINQNETYLYEKTKCSTPLLAALRQGGFLTFDESEKLEFLHETSADKAKKLYTILKDRAGAFDGLIAALESRGVRLTGAANKLKEEKKKYEDSEKIKNKRSTKDEQVQSQSSSSPQASTSSQSKKLKPEDVIDFIKNRKPLEVSLTPRKEPMKPRKDEYELPVKGKGMALVVNITKFNDKTKNRNGAEYDKDYMNDLLNDLGYRVRVYEGEITKSDFEKNLKKFRGDVQAKKPKSIVVFIGSHGEHGTIKTSDWETVSILREIVYKFNSELCEELKNKPKIFLISACQTFPLEELRTKTDEVNPVPMDDTYVLLSTTPGYLSKTDDFMGGWFTYCFTKVVMENAHQDDFKELVEKTKKAMKNIDGKSWDGYGQVCTPMLDTLGQLYFNI